MGAGCEKVGAKGSEQKENTDPVTGGAPQGSTHGPALFFGFINKLKDIY